MTFGVISGQVRFFLKNFQNFKFFFKILKNEHPFIQPPIEYLNNKKPFDPSRQNDHKG